MGSFARFRLIWAVALALVSLLVPVLGTMRAGGGAYLGIQFGLDDHMVYAAWMRQAMEGAFLLDNRFTFDPQPRLTIHLYFWALGVVAKGVGLVWAPLLARALFTGLAVWLLGRLAEHLNPDDLARKWALAMGTLGGGAGFLFWQDLGVNPSPPKRFLGSHLPVDVWQPEAFFFPSLLTNGLFMVSQCLILGVFLCALNARLRGSASLWGALWMGLLMNIHSYDALLVGLVFVGWAVGLARGIVRRERTDAEWRSWALRVGAMGLGAVPPALWFVHVLRQDLVFQARAATPTFSPPLASLLWGVGPALILVFAVLWRGVSFRREALVVSGGLAALMAVSLGQSGSAAWVGPAGWMGLFLAALAVCWVFSHRNPAMGLLVAWGAVGLAAPYFPALFQRKLAMGLGVPFGLAAGLALWSLFRGWELPRRRLAWILGATLLSASSLRWLSRELWLMGAETSNTIVHSTVIPADVVALLRSQNFYGARMVALPGGVYGGKFVPDLNPVLSGMHGAYTFAGHWSETPNYGERRKALVAFFKQDPVSRESFLRETQAEWVLAPIWAVPPDLEGERYVQGEWALVRLKPRS